MSVAVAYGLITGYYFPTVEGVYDPGFLNPDAYPVMSRTFAVVMVVAILICLFGTLFGGILLSVIEFPENAARGTIPAETIWNLGLIAGPATSIFSLLALGFYFKYKINFRRHQQIMVDLEKRRRQEEEEHLVAPDT